MSELIFISVPPKSREPIKATLYKCPSTHANVVSNEIMVPMSPYVGQAMQRVTAKRINVEASDITEGGMRVIGQCKTCDHVLIANGKAISSLSRQKPHCIYCGMQVRAMQPEMMDQVMKDVIKPVDLDDDDLHDPSDMHSDQFLAAEILASMDDDDDDDSVEDTDGNDYGDNEDSNEDSDEDDDDWNEDDDDWDEDDDEDGEDLGENEYNNDEDEDDIYGEDEAPDEEDGYEEADVNPSDDDDTMDATASIENEMQPSEPLINNEEDMENNADGGNLKDHTVDPDDVTTMEDNKMAEDAALRTVKINASDALHSSINSDSATLAVLPIDNNSAMILAMVDGVGYMPYVGLEAVKASASIKPLFANPSKLVETVNAVLANCTGNVIKDLASFGVRQLNYSVRSSALIEQRINQGVLAATDALNDEKNHLVDDLKQCLAIAATQVLKNLSDDATNVVSAALSESLSKVGVRSANNLVDEAFTKHGPELMKTIIAKALDLMNKPIAVRNEIAQYVSAATGRNVIATTTETVADRVSKTLAGGSLSATVQLPAGNTVESTPAANVIPITASSNFDYKTMIKGVAAKQRATIR